jgi:Transcriptional regulators
MPSIKDVAKLAGVSVMTASRVINYRGSVSAQARSRVLRAVKELDYRPNLTARSLRAKKSQLLGLLLPDIENPVFASLAKHVEEEAQHFGYSVMLGNTWEDPLREARYIELMRGRQMDGLIVSPVSAENDEMLQTCNMPVIVLDRSLKHNPPPPSVTVDNTEIGRIAARHLLELGHRHFACIPGPLHIDVFAERLEGYREELNRSGQKLEAVISAGQIGKIDYGMEFGSELFRICHSRPLAVFCANDLTALGVIQSAQRMGMSVPNDISVIGVDDIPAGELTMPTLTTVRQPFPGIAAAGVKLLVDMLNDRSYQPENVILPPELIVRESTGKMLKQRM